MDKATFDNLIRMLSSENDGDAVMGLRGMQGLLRAEGIDFARALEYIVSNKVLIAKAAPAAAPAPAPKAAATAAEETLPVSPEVMGMPQCFSVRAGQLEFMVAGRTKGEPVTLPGAAAAESRQIALNLKDAMVAASINKSKFRLKLQDVRNERGDISETLLRAEYEREGMVPIAVWSNVRGEVAALASVLRRALNATVPEMIAA